MNEATEKQLVSLGLLPGIVEHMSTYLNDPGKTQGILESWRVVVALLAQSGVKDFEIHRLLFEIVFRNWPKELGPAPAWSPTPKDIDTANVTSLMRDLDIGSYEALHAWSADHREEYWRRVVARLGIQFRSGYSKLLDLARGVENPRWFVGGALNIVESCFQAVPDSAAIIAQGEDGPITVTTFRQLDLLSNRVANGLVTRGFVAGDAVAIAMPMNVAAIAAYIGIIKAGCVVVSIADSFAAPEIATRLRIGQAKAIVTQDVIKRGGKRLPMFDKVAAANAPMAIVAMAATGLNAQLRPGDIQWNAFLSSNDRFNAVSRSPDDTINILFSSGTTGDPKAIPWTQTTPIKCAADACFHQNVKPGDIVAWPTNLGWMMGPWLIFSALINRATIAIYDGSPAELRFGRFIQDAQVTMLGVVPSLVSSWRRDHAMEVCDWSSIKVFSSTGEASNPDDMLYLMSLAGYRPVIEYCGGTEIGGGYITGVVVRPCAPATFNTIALGLDAVILDDHGHLTDNGEVFLKPPSIGLSTRLLNANHNAVYFHDVPRAPSGQLLRRHGDQIKRLPGGFWRALGRIDDTMNLGGIKVSSAEIERVLMSTLLFKEVAAIAISPDDGGPSGLVIYAVPENVVTDMASLKRNAQDAIKQRLNPLFRIHDVVSVESLPRTASNKVMRRVLRDRYAAGAEGKAKT